VCKAKTTITSLALLLVLLCGCNTKSMNTSLYTSDAEPSITHADFGFENKLQSTGSIEDRLPMAKPGDGFGLGLFDIQGNSYQNNVLHINGRVQFYLTLYHYVSKEMSYKLLQFIDFIQSPITIDGKTYEDGYDFNMPANGIADFPISLTIDRDGTHEVLFIFVKSSKDKTLDDDGRLDFGDHLLFYRMFILINEANLDQQTVHFDTVPLQKNVKLNGILLNKDKNELSLWLTDSSNPKTEIPCYLHVGSANEKNRVQCAIILLNEWKQVDIYDGKKVLLIELDPNQEAVIPTIISTPKEEGLYDITPIIIYSPYNVKDNLSSVRTSFRSGIQVKAPGN
jgi:hypothetical protein